MRIFGSCILMLQVCLIMPGWNSESSKARSLLHGACTSYPLFRSDLEAFSVEIKYVKRKLDHHSRYSVLTPPCELCGSLKGKLFHATKENTELKQEVAYLTARIEKTILSEKMIEKDLN
jgi:hypothetical protein